jgi:hypothetical protein
VTTSCDLTCSPTFCNAFSNSHMNVLLLALLVAITPAIAHATNESWRYNAGFLQGVSGVELKSHHTQEFMSGYINGSQIYWYNRGYAEGYSRLPMSSHNVNYTTGYRDVGDERVNFGNFGTLPAHTNDNFRDFYLGFYQGAVAADKHHDNASLDYSRCPSGHTDEYCVGYKFGHTVENDELD